MRKRLATVLANTATGYTISEMLSLPVPAPANSTIVLTGYSAFRSRVDEGFSRLFDIASAHGDTS